MRMIISICGGSGCGKTSLAVGIAMRIGQEQAARIPTDYYLKPDLCPTLQEFRGQPLVYDWDLLEAALAAEDGTEVTTPGFDFVHFRRTEEKRGRKFLLRPVLLLDGMVPYPKADLTVLVQAPEEERRRRIIDRDQRWGTDVIEFWDLHQITLAAVIIESPRFDLVLDGMRPIEENAEIVLERIKT